MWFKDAESLLSQLFAWAESCPSRDLRAYCFSLLGGAMDSEQAHQYRSSNARLIPVALRRLRELHVRQRKNFSIATNAYDDPIQAEMVTARSKEDSTPTNFAHLHQEQNGTSSSAAGEPSTMPIQPVKRVCFPPNPLQLPQHQLYTNPTNLNRSISEIHPSPQLNKIKQGQDEEAEEGGGESRLRVSSFSTAKTPSSTTRVEQNGTTPSASEVRKRRRSDGVDNGSFKRPRLVPDITETAADDDHLLPSSAKESAPSESGFSRSSFSNASWKETVLPLIVGAHPHKLAPLSIEMEQRLILHYLIPTCEYQDNLSIVLESR